MQAQDEPKLKREASRVVATMRVDDTVAGAIDGVVLAQGAKMWMLHKAETLEWAAAQLLWCQDPVTKQSVWIDPVDRSRDGIADTIRSRGDSSRGNNLRELKVWDRLRARWLDAHGNPTTAPALT